MVQKFGAWTIDSGQVEFSLWAPEAQKVELAIEGGERFAMQRRGGGIFFARVSVKVGAKYQYRIDDRTNVPDPAAHAQAGDVHDASVVVDHAFAWQHNTWRGLPWAETVIYELHVGAFGGFAGVAAQLPRLAALGITAIELMPIADFPGRHNWGYDGVLIYAPDTAYGTPHDLKKLVDTAHGLGLQVFLDVVYNHFGPDGNYLNVYAKSFFRQDIHTPWGTAIDFRSRQVRDFFIGNALYWLETYRFDGLRFDAVHAIDDSDFLLEMAAMIRATITGRHVHLILENENNDAALLTAQNYDAQWADDWHHCVHVLLTRETEGYYKDFQNPATQLARCLAEGFCYQGDPSPHQNNRPRGTASKHLPTTAFVICLQNHDQIGNRAMGERLRSLTHPHALRAAVSILLFTPQIPMIFMGDEYGETRPFLFFTDHHEDLGTLVTAGRRKEFRHFSSFRDAEARNRIPDPNDVSTFLASIPQIVENEWTKLYKDCLELRRSKIIPRLAGCKSIHAEALSPGAVRASWCMADNAILTVATNFDVAPVTCEPVAAELLYGTLSEIGMLPGLTTCLWLKT